MEAVSAASNITALISSILQGLEFVQLARSFGNDLKLHQLRLDLIRLRLSRWGQATGVCSADEEAGTDGEKDGKGAGLKDKEDEVEDLLDNIKNVLDKAMAESQKLAPKGLDAAGDSSVDADNDLRPPRFKRLQLRIRNLVQKRYLRAGDHIRGAKWVLYKKEQCEALTTQLTELIGQLEQLAAPEEELEELTREECEEMGDSLKTLVEVAEAVDPLLQATASQRLTADVMSRGVSVSAGINHGVQLGVNYGSLKGLTFGANNNITNNWK
ncbi:small secreted protein [Corynascus novoguineensis]|uniref:Small secreted protein n=1 Tax=Corynascus novoguineensis TaxID=1126955 RepID=A0AAN7CTK6_9PEZI|nr:small secreted protein [Corynascus novoguineensis]